MTSTTVQRVLQLREQDEPLIVLSRIAVDANRHGDAIELATQGARRMVGGTDGFHGAVVLGSHAQDRLVTLASWESQAQYLTALVGGDSDSDNAQLAKHASDVRTNGYRLGAVRSAEGINAADVSVEAENFCLVICVTTETTAKRDWLLSYNIWETELVMSSMPGFRSVALMPGDDPCEFAELVQWESSEHYEAASADARFQEHLAVNYHYGTADVSTHRVVGVVAYSRCDRRR
jgi:heme-degrading monooxygenase HmoA